jgi:hypothetical protein
MLLAALLLAVCHGNRRGRLACPVSPAVRLDVVRVARLQAAGGAGGGEGQLLESVLREELRFEAEEAATAHGGAGVTGRGDAVHPAHVRALARCVLSVCLCVCVSVCPCVCALGMIVRTPARLPDRRATHKRTPG